MRVSGFPGLASRWLTLANARHRISHVAGRFFTEALSHARSETMHEKVNTAPPGTGTSYRGRMLTEILYEADLRYENPRLLNQPQGEEWRPFSLRDFRRHSEEAAVGLLEMGIERGSRVALYMESDAYFCIVDMACLIAGLIDVPIYLTHAPEQIQYVIEHSEAVAVVTSTLDRLDDIRDVLNQTPSIRYVVVAEMQPDNEPKPLGGNIRPMSLADVRELGRRRTHDDQQKISELRREIAPDDLATIIYTSGTTGQPKGVMLTHENISHNALTAFSGLPDYESGPRGEVAISFLPLTHIFARALYYGFIHHATTVYFTKPDHLAAALKKVRPTIFLTVPRVLEKVYGSILDRIAAMDGPRKGIANWALGVAAQYEIGKDQPFWLDLKLRLADKLVFSKWREALGARVKYIISGGSALNPKLANLFGAAGVTILQGYGLTETSPVIAYNRPGRNRAGTVGEPIPDVEVKIAEDGEILTRGPHVMLGYYKNEERARDVIDEEGWFHTGDVGEITPEGHLRITDRKKDLFKLSTGKYVMPQPIENRLTSHALIEQAVVVGSDYKFPTALVFPDKEKLKALAKSTGAQTGSNVDVNVLLTLEPIRERFKELVHQANSGMDPWTRVKRFSLLSHPLTTENGLLTPSLKVRRAAVQEKFKEKIERMYNDANDDEYVVVERLEEHERHE